jgi:uncharacterized protein (DUF1810 family)
MSRLERFLAAQRDVYPQALAEIRAGDKRGHWMWFIFPQIAGLARSETARFYAIADIDEARDYLAHPVLGTRLEECTAAMLEWAGKRGAAVILGEVDALKFRSSMTLFEAAGGGECFARAIEAFCDKRRDVRTLDLIGRAPDDPSPQS